MLQKQQLCSWETSFKIQKNYMSVFTLTYYLHGHVCILPHDIQLNSPAVHIWFGEFATLYSQTFLFPSRLCFQWHPWHPKKTGLFKKMFFLSLHRKFPILQKFQPTITHFGLCVKQMLKDVSISLNSDPPLPFSHQQTALVMSAWLCQKFINAYETWQPYCQVLEWGRTERNYGPSKTAKSTIDSACTAPLLWMKLDNLSKQQSRDCRGKDALCVWSHENTKWRLSFSITFIYIYVYVQILFWKLYEVSDVNFICLFIKIDM